MHAGAVRLRSAVHLEHEGGGVVTEPRPCNKTRAGVTLGRVPVLEEVHRSQTSPRFGDVVPTNVNTGGPFDGLEQSEQPLSSGLNNEDAEGATGC